MSVVRIPITPKGAEQLKSELENLKSIERPKVIESIAEARAHGDLKENAEYHAARDQQGLIEARIAELEAKIPQLQVVDLSAVSTEEGKVVFGCAVELFNIDTEETVHYTLVGEDEADSQNGRISVTSPLARGLIGKYEGDEVAIITPGGEVEYEIVSVQYGQ